MRESNLDPFKGKTILPADMLPTAAAAFFAALFPFGRKSKNQIKREEAGREPVAKGVKSKRLSKLENVVSILRDRAAVYAGPQCHKPCANPKKLRRLARRQWPRFAKLAA